jgi:hypothetical protein
MANYTVITNFGAKDSLPSGNAGKLINLITLLQLSLLRLTLQQ